MATYTRVSVGRTSILWGLLPFEEVSLLDGVWYFRWPPAGVVRVVLWGNLVGTTEENEFYYPASSLHASQTKAPPLEVVPAGKEAPSERNYPYLVLQWYRVACHHYLIEYRSGVTWVFHSTLSDNADISIQTFITELLDDQVDAYWRITAIDDNKRESNPVTFHQLIVRPPDVPVGTELACEAGVLTVE